MPFDSLPSRNSSVMVIRNFLSLFQRSPRGRSRPKPGKFRPRLERLEERTMLTTTLFLDFGEGFQTGSLGGVTASDLANGKSGPYLVGEGTPDIQWITELRL